MRRALALYVAKSDGLALWKSKGDGVFPQIISKETTDPDSYFSAIAIRGKTVAALCAAPPFKFDALDFLAAALERAIEVFGLKLRSRSRRRLHKVRMFKKPISHKAAQFTESVIREMTRLAMEHDAINLSQGFPISPRLRS